LSPTNAARLLPGEKVALDPIRAGMAEGAAAAS